MVTFFFFFLPPEKHPFVREQNKMAESFTMMTLIQDALDAIQMGKLDVLQVS